MRTINELLSHHEKVWFYLAGEVVGKQFLEQAEKEGFSFSKDLPPTAGTWGYVIAAHKDKSLGHVSITVWHMSFGGDVVSCPPKIDYQKYMGGEKDFICESSHFRKL
ncbi:MAG TPA: hypothetical protein PKN28_08135 [Clostridiales bacterium]|nr:hypothetical protein [Clostridiales bacterium]